MLMTQNKLLNQKKIMKVSMLCQLLVDWELHTGDLTQEEL